MGLKSKILLFASLTAILTACKNDMYVDSSGTVKNKEYDEINVKDDEVVALTEKS